MSTWILWGLLATLLISLIAHGLTLSLLWKVWHSLTMVERSFGVPSKGEPPVLYPKAGTTFLPDDAEVARREAQMRKDSRQRAFLMRDGG